MKKILLSAAFVLLSINTTAYAAQGYVFKADDRPVTQYKYMQSAQITNLPFGIYLKYYNINTEKIDADFINLSKTEENNFLKTLTKEEKGDYKYVKKIQKIINQGDWNKVFTKYPNFLPAYLQYYDLKYQKGDYNEALRILQKIKTLDRNSQIFSPEVINKSFGFLYFVTGQYTSALRYFKMYENTNDDFITVSLANCYYAMGQYAAAIECCKRLPNLQYQDIELMFGAYYKLKNYSEANKYAQQLLKQNYSFQNLMRVQETTSDESAKLSYCYRARNLAQNDTELYDVNQIIAQLEQKKLEKSASKLTKFVKIPKWQEFEVQIPEIVTEQEVSLKQDEFFKTANSYLSKYSGQELTNAFNSLNQEMTTYVQNKRNDYYKEQQLAAQKALVAEQQRNNMLQQQIIREQQIRNYLERQNFYFYSSPYYWHPRYYPWW